MLKATHYLGCMGKGLTQPQAFVCDDGYQYVIKFKENPVGVKVLVNELIANRIANLLGLPVPMGTLIYTPAQVITATTFQEGIHFGILMIPNILRHPPLALIEGAYNVDCIPGMYVFDNYLVNPDRHYGNIVLCTRNFGNQIILIDHSHCFAKPQWTDVELRELTHYDKILTRGIYQNIAHIITGQNSLDRWLDRLENIAEEQLVSIVNEIPREWNITSQDREALLFYLTNRKRRLRSLLTSAR